MPAWTQPHEFLWVWQNAEGNSLSNNKSQRCSNIMIVDLTITSSCVKLAKYLKSLSLSLFLSDWRYEDSGLYFALKILWPLDDSCWYESYERLFFSSVSWGWGTSLPTVLQIQLCVTLLHGFQHLTWLGWLRNGERKGILIDTGKLW